MLNVAYDKKQKKWLPIFAFKKILKNAANYDELLHYVKLVHSKKNKNFWNKGYLNFKKLIYYQKNTQQLYQFVKNKK